MENLERYYIATLHAISLIGHQSVKKLIEKFGSAESIWRADLSQLQAAKLNPKGLKNFIEFRAQYPDAVEKLVKFCEVKKVKICTFYDDNYPPILREMSGSPVVFYYRGELNPNVERVSIVGTREPTEYGEYVAATLSAEFAQIGLTVVSGAARGIDTIAHKAALNFGRTVAVLGYGMNKISPEKQKFFDKIVEKGGVVLTDFPPNYSGDKNTFPARNRIIAGLSRSVIIVEAGEKSGALITAGFAADNSREVFVIPHSIFSEKGIGCNNLIREGATLITSAADVLDSECYDSKKFILKKVLKNAEKQSKERNIFDAVPQNDSIKKSAPEIELKGAEKFVYDAIPQDEAITLDEILMSIDEISTSEISSIILQLELKGYISENNGAYIRC